MRQADRFILNVLSNYGRMAVQTVASLVVLPIVVRHLGRSGLGLVWMILAAYTVFEMLGVSMGRSLQRFIPQALKNDDSREVNLTFNTAICGFVLVGVIGAVAILPLRGWLFEGESSSPAQLADSHRAFYVMVAWLALGFPFFVYPRGLESLQRYDLSGVYDCGFALARAVALATLFLAGMGSITVYIAVQLLMLLGTCLLARRALHRLIPGLKVSLRYVDGRVARNLAVFTGGTLLVLVGNLCTTSGFRLFVGKRFGMEELGGLAAVLTLSNLAWQLIYSMANALTPAISTMEAQGSHESIAKLLVAGTKYSVLVATLLCMVPLSVAGSFLRLWLGDAFKGLDALLFVLLLAQIPIAVGTPPQLVLMGLGRLEKAGPIMFSRGVIGLAAGWSFVQFIKPSFVGAALCLYGVMGAGALSLFMHACHVTGQSCGRALLHVLGLPVALGAVSAAAMWLVASQIGSDRWWSLIVSAGCGELLFAALVLAVGLTQEERLHLGSFARKALARVG